MTDHPAARRFLLSLALVAALAGIASTVLRPTYARVEGSMLALAQWLRPAEAGRVAWYDTSAPGGTTVDRGVLADAVTRIAAARPRVIVITQPLEGGGGSADLARVRGFLESPEAAADPALRARLQAWAAELDYDARLERAIRDAGAVVLHARAVEDAVANDDAPPPPFASPALAADALPRAPPIAPPLPRFVAAARAVGTDAPETADADGVRRSESLLAGDAKAGAPGLVAAAWIASRGAGIGSAQWQGGTLTIPGASRRVNDDGGWVPWYRGRGDDSRHARGPVATVVESGNAPADLAGRAVVLGPAAPRIATPVGSLPLPETIAQQIASLEAEDYARRPAWAWLAAGLLLLAAPAVAALATVRLAPRARLLAAAVIAIGLVVLELVALAGAKLWLPLIGPAFAFPVAMLATLLTRADRVATSALRAGAAATGPVPSRAPRAPRPTPAPTSARPPAAAPPERAPPSPESTEAPTRRPPVSPTDTTPVARQSTRRVAEAAAAHPMSIRDISDQLRARQEEPTRADVADLLLGRSKRPPKPRLGRYELERELGHGAMGTVYLGRDPNINRVLAVKAIPLAQEFEGDALAEARTRFFREAEMAGRLNHPAIVTVYDAGEDNGIAFIAMEYVKGRLLSDHSTSDVLLPAPQVLEIVAKIADALDYAHQQDIVHRDIKPANVIFDPQTLETKITDFGIARLTNSSSTRTGIVLGTPSFMAPEQLEGRFVTGRSDLFSLGVTLFQLLAGQLPFRADSMTGLMDKIANAPHPPLRTIRPDLPPCVALIVDRALQKDPAKRFATGAEMARALRACARSVAA
jgi:predicted Ser/Thr protein kinase